MGMAVEFVVQWWVILGNLVAPVDTPGGPIKTELILGSTAMQPVKRMSVDLVLRGTFVLLVTPAAAELSV